jgi:hypothetical protein
MKSTKILLLIQIFLFIAFSLTAQDWRAGIHDPSSIVKCKDTYWVFGTGDGIYSMYSKDLVTWKAGPAWVPFQMISTVQLSVAILFNFRWQGQPGHG